MHSSGSKSEDSFTKAEYKFGNISLPNIVYLGNLFEDDIMLSMYIFTFKAKGNLPVQNVKVRNSEVRHEHCQDCSFYGCITQALLHRQTA